MAGSLRNHWRALEDSSERSERVIGEFQVSIESSRRILVVLTEFQEIEFRQRPQTRVK